MDKKKFLEDLLREVKVSNVGELKENDVLVFQFDHKDIDAHKIGTFARMIREEGINAIIFPQADKIVEKCDMENALKILEMAKKSLEKMIYHKNND